MIYFAYGSNMDEKRMRRRCPSAQFLFIARLPGFRLAFTHYSTINRCGTADITPDKNCEVWGVVYQVKDEHRWNVTQGTPSVKRAEVLRFGI